MTTDLTASPPTRQALAARDRSLPGKIGGRLKTALDLVVGEGLDPYEAAAKVGMHARSMRLALNKRHVLAYLRHAREVLRTTASAQNIHYAIKMRAESPNEMARLGAMKFIDNEEEHQRLSGGRQMMPGLQIVVMNAPPSLRSGGSSVTIDTMPAPESSRARAGHDRRPRARAARRAVRHADLSAVAAAVSGDKRRQCPPPTVDPTQQFAPHGTYPQPCPRARASSVGRPSPRRVPWQASALPARAAPPTTRPRGRENGRASGRRRVEHTIELETVEKKFWRCQLGIAHRMLNVLVRLWWRCAGERLQGRAIVIGHCPVSKATYAGSAPFKRLQR